MTRLTFTLNGQPINIDADPQMPLLWALRDLLGLTGTKYGCGIGLCGTCTVLLDGEAVRSCAMPVGKVQRHEVITIEGLAASAGYSDLHPLQRAWLDEDVVECGYCQPGQIMQAAALLNQIPVPTDTQIVEAMSGVLCRCGTYNRILKAVRRAAEGIGD